MRRLSIASVALLLGHLCSGQATAQEPSYSPFGVGCAGSAGTPILAAESNSLPILADTFAVELSNLPDGPAIGILGRSTNSWAGLPLPLDLGFLGMPGCTLYTDLRRTTQLNVVGGHATWTLPVPAEADLLGMSFFQQALAFDPSGPGLGAVMSNAAEGIIGVLRPSPLVKIAFPPPSSQTDADTILVRGTAFDPDGVAEVRVNGELATTSDGFGNWTVRVPLDAGLNLLAVEARDTLGNSDPRATDARIDFQARLQDPIGIAIDRTRNRALVSDRETRAIIAVDLTTGNRRALSNATNGDGSLMVAPGSIALDGLRALVVDQDSASRAIFAVDLVSGDREILSDDSHGEGPLFFGPSSIAIDGTRDRALVTDKLNGAVFAVDLAKGTRTVLSDASTGAGPSMLSPVGIVIDPAGNRALVTDLFLATVLAIDLDNGDRTLVSGGGKGSGQAFAVPYEITLSGSRALVTDNSGSQLRGRLMAVDLVTGDRSVVSDVFHGTGPRFATTHALVMDGPRVLIANTGIDAIIAVDLSNGDRRVFTDEGNGNGPVFGGPRGITLDGTRALITDPELGTVIAMDIATGDRTLITDGLGRPTGIDVSAGQAFVIDEDLNAVVTIDLATGSRRTFTGDNKGAGRTFVGAAAIVVTGNRALVADIRAIVSILLVTGTRVTLSAEWSSPTGLALDGNRLLMTDRFSTAAGPGVVAIDLASGLRSELSGDTIGEGPAFLAPRGIAVDKDHALVTGFSSYSGQARILSVDLATGDRAAISDSDTGTGPQLMAPRGIAKIGSFVLVADGTRHAILAVDTQTGERVTLSK